MDNKQLSELAAEIAKKLKEIEGIVKESNPDMKYSFLCFEDREGSRMLHLSNASNELAIRAIQYSMEQIDAEEITLH